jgi:hypothetical protein
MCGPSAYLEVVMHQCQPDPNYAALVLILTKLQSMEDAMATAAEQLTELAGKIDDVAADFAAFRDAMLAERENLTPSGQAALDSAVAKLAALDTEVGDADGSDTPVTEPTPEG